MVEPTVHPAMTKIVADASGMIKHGILKLTHGMNLKQKILPKHLRAVPEAGLQLMKDKALRLNGFHLGVYQH